MGSGASTPRSLPDKIDKDKCKELAGESFNEELFDSLKDEEGNITKEAFLREKSALSMKNAAFVFIKPHACTEAVQEMVKAKLVDKGLTILSEGDISSEDIDSKKLIDQHYYAIASKATILKPADLAVPSEKFQEAFGESWEAVLKAGTAYNAMDACEYLGVDAAGLDAEWKKCTPTKFGGGFYCGKIDSVEGKEPCYVFNAFFMVMRSKFTAPGEKIHYYSVEWTPSALSWADFRGSLLGPTDPKEGPPESIRNTILTKWEEFGLKSEPDKGDNGVHASASPFEGLAERMNWLGAKAEDDPFGSSLIAKGLSAETIQAWSVDPRVKMAADGTEGSIFDALEDMDAAPCLDKMAAISEAQA